MPANKNAMTRYMILDELLSNRYHDYSLDDLTEEVSRRLSELYSDTKGVVRRTIEKDIDYIENYSIRKDVLIVLRSIVPHSDGGR